MALPQEVGNDLMRRLKDAASTALEPIALAAVQSAAVDSLDDEWLQASVASLVSD